MIPTVLHLKPPVINSLSLSLQLLVNHIHDCLPELKERVSKMSSHFQSRLDSFGEEVEDESQVLLEVLTKFNTAYCATIEGTDKKVETGQLGGGARICKIFQDTFQETLAKIDPLAGLNFSEILIALQNASVSVVLFVCQLFTCDLHLFYREFVRVSLFLDYHLKNWFVRRLNFFVRQACGVLNWFTRKCSESFSIAVKVSRRI